jgi:copper transport protein
LLAFKLAALGVLLWLGAMSRSIVQRRYAAPMPEPDEAEAAIRSKRRAVRAAQLQERVTRTQLGQSVRLEAATAVAVLAVASVLVATPPGTVVTAAEALETSTSTGPVLDEAALGVDGAVQVLVDPAWVGQNRVVVEIVDLDGEPLDVPDVQASFVLPAGDLEPLPVDLTKLAEGVYEAASTTIPIAGDWQLRVVVRTTEIDSTAVQVEVPVL